MMTDCGSLSCRSCEPVQSGLIGQGVISMVYYFRELLDRLNPQQVKHSGKSLKMKVFQRVVLMQF